MHAGQTHVSERPAARGPVDWHRLLESAAARGNTDALQWMRDTHGHRPDDAVVQTAFIAAEPDYVDVVRWWIVDGGFAADAGDDEAAVVVTGDGVLEAAEGGVAG
ncbi:uncharacterized protein ACA1_317650 [Acanthamoeba castellanii str. Neff]|uniref:Uncharacterized protein n=1 Tax=Acanthamoeba castellanii (strain ATCC 30010 / Neff) TaxID=1257118 RepID=L8H6W5_ACACF|nr:uncharacterized protein ACA1_317650 [Acanthamoeba castellanii str. Neff]ELR20473.1 hypothetical protein ACA1_317650 [Acanthamoeba castellanii str. Neff]